MDLEEEAQAERVRYWGIRSCRRQPAAGALEQEKRGSEEAVFAAEVAFRVRCVGKSYRMVDRMPEGTEERAAANCDGRRRRAFNGLHKNEEHGYEIDRCSSRYYTRRRCYVRY